MPEAKKLSEEARFAGLRKHVIPALGCAMAWDLCFLKPSFRFFSA